MTSDEDCTIEDDEKSISSRACSKPVRDLILEDFGFSTENSPKKSTPSKARLVKRQVVDASEGPSVGPKPPVVEEGENDDGRRLSAVMEKRKHREARNRITSYMSPTPAVERPRSDESKIADEPPKKRKQLNPPLDEEEKDPVTPLRLDGTLKLMTESETTVAGEGVVISKKVMKMIVVDHEESFRLKTKLTAKERRELEEDATQVPDDEAATKDTQDLESVETFETAKDSIFTSLGNLVGDDVVANFEEDEKEGPQVAEEELESDDVVSQSLDSVSNSVSLPDLSKESEYDVVMFSVSTLSSETPPKPSPESPLDDVLGYGDPRFVRLPFSTKNEARDGKQKYLLIEKALQNIASGNISSLNEVEEEVSQYLQTPWTALKHYTETFETETKMLKRLAKMAALALKLPSLITQPLPLLRAGSSGSVTLSQEQIASLLANAFFNTFPEKPRGSPLNAINFNRIHGSQTDMAIEKMRFFMAYFDRVIKKMPTGAVSYRHIAYLEFPNWRKQTEKIADVKVLGKGCIENKGKGMLQVDFANKFVGGGVLNEGNAQEEIRFLICPEMIISCLLCERLADNEAVRIVGAGRYSNYKGYGNSLEYQERLASANSEPRDKFYRIETEVVAIDALDLRKHDTKEQFEGENINRELNKAYVGFLRDGHKEEKRVATGGWGCGVFGGDKELKFLIQLMAATVNQRDILLCTFGDSGHMKNCRFFYELLQQYDVTVGQLYRLLLVLDPGSDMSVMEQLSKKVAIFQY